MYSTGTEFTKALAEAVKKPSFNTAAEQAENAKELIESWTGLHVVQMTVKGSEKSIQMVVK